VDENAFCKGLRILFRININGEILKSIIYSFYINLDSIEIAEVSPFLNRYC